MADMTILESIILGIVEGLTEYLPVSSTGHLIITQYFLGMEDTDATKAFDVCIQSGAILAVLGLYFKRVMFMLHGLLGLLRIGILQAFSGILQALGKGSRPHAAMTGQEKAGMRMLANIVIAFLPAAVIGILFAKQIKSLLFNAPTVTITWAVGGLVILCYVWLREKKGVGNKGKNLEELGWRGALSIGFMQCIAMCPGTSRSLMTMLSGLFVGLSVSAAVEFSFLLGLITLGGATCYDAYKHGADMVASIGWPALIAGTATAWISAVIAVKWMVGYLNRHSLAIFGWYRLAAATGMLILICNGFMFNDEKTESQTPAAAPVQAVRN